MNFKFRISIKTWKNEPKKREDRKQTLRSKF